MSETQDSNITKWFNEGNQITSMISVGSLANNNPADNTKPRKVEAFDPSTLDYMPKEDSLLKVCNAGMEGEGPWSDKTSTSPILNRKLSPDKSRTHTITIGKEFLKDGQALRRVKIYEHEFSTSSWDPSLINNLLKSTPEKALVLSNVILRNPNVGQKIVDKLMEKESGIKGLSGAQATLVPLFGCWLNAHGPEDGDLEAASDTIYLVWHNKNQGTVAKALKPLSKNNKRLDVREKLTKDLQHQLVQIWESQRSTGFSFQIVTPLGKNDIGYYF